jgi:hypothetical protein
MHRNPVQRKLVQHPKDWPWSRWSFYAHGEGMITIDVRGARQQKRKPAPLNPKGAAPNSTFPLSFSVDELLNRVGHPPDAVVEQVPGGIIRIQVHAIVVVAIGATVRLQL